MPWALPGREPKRWRGPPLCSNRSTLPGVEIGSHSKGGGGKMSIHMKGKSLASLYDLTREEIEQILKTSELLKLQSLRGQEHPLLKGRHWR